MNRKYNLRCKIHLKTKWNGKYTRQTIIFSHFGVHYLSFFRLEGRCERFVLAGMVSTTGEGQPSVPRSAAVARDRRGGGGWRRDDTLSARIILMAVTTQQTQNIWFTFIQCWTSVWSVYRVCWVCLVHRLRRWTNIKPTSVQHLVFAGWVLCRDVLSESRGLLYSFYPKKSTFFNVAVTESEHGGDRERSRTQCPENFHNFLMTARKMSWACDLVAEMLLIKKKHNNFLTWLFEGKS